MQLNCIFKKRKLYYQLAFNHCKPIDGPTTGLQILFLGACLMVLIRILKKLIEKGAIYLHFDDCFHSFQ